jgi:hypothetical protein
MMGDRETDPTEMQGEKKLTFPELAVNREEVQVSDRRAKVFEFVGQFLFRRLSGKQFSH